MNRRKNLPDPKLLLGKTLPGSDGYVLREFLGKGCNGIVFKAYSESLNNNVAYKLIPHSNLAAGDAWKTEPRMANSLSNRAVVRCNSFVDWPDEDVVCLQYEYVDGISLKEYLRTSGKELSVNDIRTFFAEILRLFFEMKKRNIQHGDFHSGNILVRAPTEYELEKQYEFRVTDFGVGKVTGSARVLDDYMQLARVLREMLDIIDYQAVSPRDKYLYTCIEDHFISRALCESDSTIEPMARSPDLMLTHLEGLVASYEMTAAVRERPTMKTPYDFLNCEQIGKAHSLLHALYSDKFLGMSTIEARNNLVVTGPRGCGKSTVFQSLSLIHRILAESEREPTFDYIGIYFRCNDLYWKFPRYEKPSRAEAIDLPLHYLTARLVGEVVRTLEVMQRIRKPEQIDEPKICQLLWTRLALKRPKLPNADTFATLLSAIDRECQWAADKSRFANVASQSIRRLYGPNTLVEITEELIQTVPALSGHPFYFFIDDYSMPLISRDLQANLNRLLMQRSASCFFKLATESPVSFIQSDLDEKQYVEGREYELLNLGLIFVLGNDLQKDEFIDDVFNRRLRAVESYPIRSFKELVGENPGFVQNALAELLGGGQPVEWWGSKCVVAMCSGDIHQIITIVKLMEEYSGGQTNLESGKGGPAISPKNQTKGIRQHAGQFLHVLARSGEDCKKAVDVVEAFGAVAYSHLKFKRSKNEDGNPRRQASRIELHDAPDFDGEAKQIYETLLRYSVFVEDPRGKSMRGRVVRRLYLRRFLIPHFKLTFSKRDSIRMDSKDFEMLLMNPALFEKQYTVTQESIDDDNGEDGQGGQMPLLGPEGEPSGG